jgi:enoyl-CoA hydratase/carnithine racemase
MNGNAVGVGVTMCLPADIRIVSESAKLALPFVKRGITLEGMSAYILPRLVGHASECFKSRGLSVLILC